MAETKKQIQEQGISLDKLQEELIKRVAELTQENTQLKQDTEDLKGRHKEVCEHAEKLEGLVKEQEAIIEALREELKERDEAKCIPAEPRVYESVEEKRDSMYRHLVEEECFYEYQIREFKHRIIEGTQVDLAKAKLKDAKKNLKRIKRVKKAALK